MAKIVFVSTNIWGWGGSEYLWFYTAIECQKNGHYVTASIPPWITIPSQVLELPRKDIKLVIRKKYALSLFKRVVHKVFPTQTIHYPPIYSEYEFLKEINPQLVVISQGANLDGASCMEYCNHHGIPYVTLSQAASDVQWPSEAQCKILERTYPAARCNFFVSKSNWKLTQIQIGEELKNNKVVYNPFNVQEAACEKYPPVSDYYYLASVARYELHAKGQDLLLQVLSDPKWKRRNLFLRLYGKGRDEYIIRKMITYFGLHNVQVMGYTNDVTSIWNHNHALILTSRYEGLPLALVEAMMCGRIGIVSDVSGNGEILADNETGFIGSPQVPMLDEALERAWNQRENWEEMGKNAQKHIQKQIPSDPVGYFYNQLITQL